MATRLSVITTRTGDEGLTGLGDGSRVSKDTQRIAAMGDVDELNSVLGLWRTESLDTDIDTLLGAIQHDLFDLGAELCIPGYACLNASRVAWLDTAIAEHNAVLSKLEEFILPGGTRPAALAHMARTVCRRAERSVVALANAEGACGVTVPARQYLNRLSDLCFVLARVLNLRAGQNDVLWQREPAT